MDEKVARFMQAQAKAKKLIEMDTRGTLDSYAKEAKRNGKMEYNEQVEYTTEKPSTYTQTSYNTTPLTQTKSKLPKEILESMQNNPINQVGSIATPSVLDQLNIFPQKQEVIVEEKKVISEVQQQQPNQNIDYSMIRMIVEDCVKKYTSALKKSIINENKSNDTTLKAMKFGNKFSFITNDGDLYEAELKFIKNINEKSDRN
ncbi:MAG: hypothetical protein IKT40_02705 [Bacilli bacterium]|nr:hypothetical protein [Bacilli bacterium]